MENVPRPTKQVHPLSLPTGVVLLANVILSGYVFADDFIGSRRAQSATHFNNKNY
jgi:predicted O-methyltransferase YrrM